LVVSEIENWAPATTHATIAANPSAVDAVDALLPPPPRTVLIALPTWPVKSFLPALTTLPGARSRLHALPATPLAAPATVPAAPTNAPSRAIASAQASAPSTSCWSTLLPGRPLGLG